MVFQSKRYMYPLLFPFLFFLFSCVEGEKASPKLLGKELPYDLVQEGQKHVLGFELEEISGLSWDGEDMLACIQDEEGIIYRFDLKKDKVTERIKFKKSGDYEGIERIGSEYYVVKSSGKLFKVIPKGTEPAIVEEIENSFTAENNIEALGLDFEENRLLLGTKGKGSIKGEDFKGKGVYGIDPVAEKPKLKYLFNIPRSEINHFLKPHEDELRGGYGISGIALHPLEKTVFVISSEGEFLLVLDRSGQIITFAELPRKKFKQPEGICFSPDGDLFISNEGRGGNGNILHFKYKPKTRE